MARRGPKLKPVQKQKHRRHKNRWGVVLGTVAPALALMELLILPFLVTSPGALATTFSNRPLGSVVEEARLIVRGKAGTSAADWGKGDAKGSIFTYTDFVVTEVLKNATGAALDNGDKIILKQPGGEKNGVEMSVAATAAFNPGDDVVLTLANKDGTDEAYTVLNFTAGKYNIVEENGETYLENSLGGGEVYDPGRGEDAKVLSYNSRIPLETMRALARGEQRPEANRNQFAPSDKAGPRSDGHNHEPIKSQLNPQQQKAPDVGATENQVLANDTTADVSESSSTVYWLVGFAVLITLGFFGLVISLKKRGDS